MKKFALITLVLLAFSLSGCSYDSYASLRESQDAWLGATGGSYNGTTDEQ